jgi:lysozyme family protein
VRGNFAACDAFTAPAEAGLSMDPQDPGNWTGGQVGVGELRGTKYGIAASAHPGVNIAALTPELAAGIRQAQYWMPNRCDDLPRGFDLMVYDEDVNAGDARSAKLMQAILGVNQDGVIGDKTLQAMRSRGVTDLITALSRGQAQFYQSLPGFPHDGKGWMARLQLRTVAALKMAA